MLRVCVHELYLSLSPSPSSPSPSLLLLLLLLLSPSLPQYLQQVKAFGDVEGLAVTITVSRFHADVARYPGMVFRGFVYEVRH